MANVKKRGPHKKNIFSKSNPYFVVSLVFTFLLFLALFAFYLGPQFVGFTVGKESFSFTDSLNTELQESSHYEWQPENSGILKSVKLSGSIFGEGNVKVYLDDLLIFEYPESQESGKFSITGKTIGALEDSADEESSDSNGEQNEGSNSDSEDSQDSEESNGETPEDSQEDSNDTIIDEPEEDSNETIEEDFDETNETIYEDLNDTIEDDINETIEEDLNETIDESINDSDGKIDEDLEEVIIEFSKVCKETCDLEEFGLNKSSYTLNVEVEGENVTLLLSDIEYEVLRFVKESVDEEVNETIEEPIEEIIDEDLNDTLEDYFDSINFTDDLIQHQAVLNQPVKWEKKINPSEVGKAKVSLPKEAKNVNVKKVKDGKEKKAKVLSITGGAVTEFEGESIFSGIFGFIGNMFSTITGRAVDDELEEEFNDTIEDEESLEEEIAEEVNETIDEGLNDAIEEFPEGFVDEPVDEEVNETIEEEIVEEKLDDLEDVLVEIEVDELAEFVIEFETPAPYAVEEEISNGKRIIVVGPEEVHYENVLAFTELSEDLNLRNPSQLRINWIEENQVIEPSNVSDLSGNGIYDYVEWVVPHLSNQTFEIIVITKAEHLDEDRNFVEDVYDIVSVKNETFYEIPENNYLRVTFERNLTSSNDITIYAKSENQGRVEVYEKDSNVKIADFGEISEYEMHKIFLTELEGEQDTFDLRVINGSVEFDYVVDPVGIGIKDCEGLQKMIDYLGEDFYLENDINCSGFDFDGSGFLPVGNFSNPFTGDFDGQGYIILDLHIDRDKSDYVGLFGYTFKSQIKNVKLKDIDIIGADYVGGLVGYLEGSLVEDSYVVGESEVFGLQYVGGLIGYNDDGSVLRSHSMGSGNLGGVEFAGGLIGLNYRDKEGIIVDSSSTWYVSGFKGSGDSLGGLVGRNDGRIRNSISKGNVSGTNNIGGFVGIHNSGLIQGSSAFGNVSGDENVGGLVGRSLDEIGTSFAKGNVDAIMFSGGLVGYNEFEINNSYASGNVTGSRTGGLVGYNVGGSSLVENSYSVGYVDGLSDLGGLVGVNEGSVVESFYDEDTSGQSDTGKGSPYPTSTMQDYEFFQKTSWDIEERGAFDPEDPSTWYIDDGNDYPRLAREFSNAILSCADLQNISNDLSEDYYLFNDIDCSDTTNWNGGAGFEPIGTIGEPFTGTLDGNGHTILDLFIYRPSENHVGLFGYINNGMVKNLNVDCLALGGQNEVGVIVGTNWNGTILNSCVYGEDLAIVGGDLGDNYVGGLVGFNFGGFINNSCVIARDIKGTTYVGGFVGRNGGEGVINNSYAIFSGVIVGYDESVGGFVGYNYQPNSKILNSYSFAEKIIGDGDKTGGFVGYNKDGFIANSYSKGAVEGSSNQKVGGFVGHNSGDWAHIADSYSFVNVTGYVNVGGFVGYNDNSGEIYMSYSAGLVEGNETAGGFAGMSFVEDGIKECFWDINASNQTTSSGDAEGKTTEEMKDYYTFANSGWDIERTTIEFNDGYPFLSWQMPGSSPTWYIKGDSHINLERIYPTENIEVGFHEVFNITLNVTCFYEDCGDINISFDPVEEGVPLNFTTCGAEGRFGPSQGDCDTEYSETDLEGEVNIIGDGIQEWVVPYDGIYVLEAHGAQGGDNSASRAGKGAFLKGEFELESGDNILILSGQKGGDGPTSNGDGGGGGTFIAKVVDPGYEGAYEMFNGYHVIPLLVAGGGAGGYDASPPADFGDGYYTGEEVDEGGILTTSNVGAGASWSEEGENDATSPAIPFIEGGLGGEGSDADGGFGGGGGTDSWNNGGGGGGYQGGNSDYSAPEKTTGGGSYNIGENQTNIAGYNEGDGFVTIIPLSLEGKVGLISTTPGDEPFWMNDTNPRTINLNEGQSQLVTAWVNATGDLGETYTFFEFANLTTDMSTSSQTSDYNVTIKAPTISLERLYPTENIEVGFHDVFNVTVNVTCLEANCGDINVSLDPEEFGGVDILGMEISSVENPIPLKTLDNSEKEVILSSPIYENNDFKVIFNDEISQEEVLTFELKSHKDSVNELRKMEKGWNLIPNIWYEVNSSVGLENALSEPTFIDMKTGKEIEREWYFVYGEREEVKVNVAGEESYEEVENMVWSRYDSRDIPEGSINLGIMVYVEEDDWVDGIWEVGGRKIYRHAQWIQGIADYIYIGGATNQSVWKMDSDFNIVAVSPDYGGDIEAMVIDDDYVYYGGELTRTVIKAHKSNLSTIEESPDYGGHIFSIAIDDDYVYYGGFSPRTLRKAYKTNLTTITDSPNYGGAILSVAIDDDYVYYGGELTRTVIKAHKSNLSEAEESPHYGGNIHSIAVDDDYVYYGGADIQTVIKAHKSDLSEAEESPDYGGTITSVAIDDDYVYYGGEGSRTVIKAHKSNLSEAEEGPEYGGRIHSIAIDDDYVYYGGALTRTVRKAHKSNLSTIIDSPIYDGVIRSIALESLPEIKCNLVSTIPGDTPFWTNVSNPYTVDLDEGQSYVVTWYVNATGELNTTHTFFEFANLTADMSISNQTSDYNVTIMMFPPSEIKFSIANSSGIAVASIDDKGDMYLRGSKYEGESSLSAPENSFIIKNNAGTTIAYINDLGDFYLLGAVSTHSDLSGMTSTNLEIRNSTEHLVAFFDNVGNLKLQGGLFQGYENP